MGASLATTSRPGSPSIGALLAVWLLAGVSLFAFLGSNLCQRTQEARVLTTAREVLQGGGERWLLPTCNGELRLRKPPLPYWLSAAAFWVSGEVNEWSGRAPAAISAWLTLAIIYLAGTRFFSPRVGLLGAGLLLTSYLFYRYGRLAETDILATMFVTLATWLFWRSMTVERLSSWLSLAAGLSAGGALMAKGAPGAFPFLFVLIFGCAQRQWLRLLRTIAMGLVGAALVAAPWYVYVWAKGYWPVLQSELDIVAGGEDHAGSIWALIVEVLQATLPWTIFCILASIVATYTRWRDPAIQGLLFWALAILVPLACTGNKQLHYTMPAMPPLMLLAAWLLDRAIAGELNRHLVDAVRRIMLITLVIFVLAGLASIIWGIFSLAGAYETGREAAGLPAIVLGGALASAGAASLITQWRRGLWHGAIGAITTCAIAAPLLAGWWAAKFQPVNVRDAADGVLAHGGHGEMIFWKSGPSLPLVFALQRIIPYCADQARLDVLAGSVDPTVIIQTGPGDPQARLPEPWQLVWRGGPKGQHFQLFRATNVPAPAAGSPAR